MKSLVGYKEKVPLYMAGNWVNCYFAISTSRGLFIISQ